MANNAWSESRGNERAYADHVMEHAVDGVLADDVRIEKVKKGVIMIFDCNRCGRQEMAIEIWPVVQQMFLDRPLPPQLGIQRVRDGWVLPLVCPACQKPNRMLAGYSDLDDWVGYGVRTGILSPQLYAVRQAQQQK